MSPFVVASLVVAAVVVLGVLNMFRKRTYKDDPPELPTPSGKKDPPPEA